MEDYPNIIPHEIFGARYYLISKLIYKKDKFYIKEQTRENILADVSTLDCLQLCGGMVTSPLYRSDTTEKMIPIVAHVAKKVS